MQAAPMRTEGILSSPVQIVAECLTELNELYPLAPEWERLVKRAADPNIFYEPWMMLSSLELFSRRMRLEVVAVYAEGSGERRLVGLFPFERPGRFGRLGGSVVQSLRYYYCSLCTPLVDPDYGPEAVAAALAALRSRCTAVEFRLVGADGKVLGWLEQAAAAEPGYRQGERIERAFLRRFESAQAYVASSFSREAKKKDMARLERRLAALGDLRLSSLRDDQALEPWLSEFLELEASGWKGRKGSALVSVAGGAEFLRRVCRAAHARGRLERHDLRLNGRPLAMMCMMRVADGMIFLRTAYDEGYSRYSPGLLLAFKFSCQLHERPGIEWLDSCSDPKSVMPNRVWKQRRPLASFSIHYGAKPMLAAMLGSTRERPGGDAA